MILFGLLKKGVVRVEETGKGKTPKVVKIEGVDKSKLGEYELKFLEAIKPNGVADLRKLRTAMVKMIKDVNKRIKGFSRRETRDYYQHIVDLAWRHVTTANTPELLGEEWSDKLEWIMMDKKFGDRMGETFTGREVVAPRWYVHNYFPSRSGTASMKGVGQSIGKSFTSGADMANKMVTGFESFSGKFISNIESFASGVTRVTNPAPKSSGSYSRGSSGGGCACACACAGCACACAGGGRKI